jgi:hypothetical protein
VVCAAAAGAELVVVDVAGGVEELLPELPELPELLQAAMSVTAAVAAIAVIAAVAAREGPTPERLRNLMGNLLVAFPGSAARADAGHGRGTRSAVCQENRSDVWVLSMAF